MRVGAVFPQTEIGSDPAAVRDYAQAVEALGFDHLLAFDHVLGANVGSRPGWGGAYDSDDMFHEILVLFGYLASLTKRIELVSGIVILPQRQTALVAKQTAEVDVLSGGRLRLGIGIGWNAVEYEALGEDFTNRGRRCEEQIEVLRALWTRELVTYKGEWHRIIDAGINPLPVRRPIPIWFGGHADAVLRRVGRLGDGWIPLIKPDEKARAAIETLRGHARAAGRDPGEIGIESWLTLGQKPPEAWAEWIGKWRDLGATHVSVNTMKSGLGSPQAHIDAIGRFKEVFDGT